jgi:L-threonylcarbamoyladenylate synthase
MSNDTQDTGSPAPAVVTANSPAGGPLVAPIEPVEAAALRLREGALVAFPTETVYGLGADAGNDAAVERIFVVKGRPAGHPLIVHVASAAQMGRWAREVPPAAQCLAETFWPGPLTLILKRREGVANAAAGGLDTIGLRVPSHPVAQALLTAFGGGIAAPSANRFGRISPTTAEHVRAEFRIADEEGPAIEDIAAAAAASATDGTAREVASAETGAVATPVPSTAVSTPVTTRPTIDMLLDGGATEVGIESTIVDLTRGAPVILRPGRISEDAIRRALDAAGIEFEAAEGAPAAAPAAPGTLESHYAPRAALRIMPRRDFTDILARYRSQRIAVLALEVSVPRVPVQVTRILPASANLYARGLYAALRELDALGADIILVEAPPAGGHWTAVNDRLRRAAHDQPLGSRAERHSQPWKGRKPPAKATEATEAPGEGGGDEAAGEAPGDERPGEASGEDAPGGDAAD